MIKFIAAVRKSQLGLPNTQTAVVGRQSHCEAFCPRSGQSCLKKKPTAHMWKVETKASVFKNRPFPLFKGISHSIKLAILYHCHLPTEAGGIWKQSSRPTVDSIDQTGAWWGGGVPPLSTSAEPRAGATISQLRHIVIKICTAGAQRQCLEPESAGFVRSAVAVCAVISSPE